MSLEKVLSISEKPGLFKLITNTRNGFIAESLMDGKRISVGLHNIVSLLSEFAIYTLTEEIPLTQVLKTIRDKENSLPTKISHKGKKDELEAFFFDVLPDYDEDRVYVSDIKKVIRWYNILQSNEMLYLLDGHDENNDEEE